MKLTELARILDRAFAINAMEDTQRVVPYVEGEPGTGKTQKFYQYAQMRGIPVYSYYGPSASPTDLVCYMPDQTTGKLKAFFNERLPSAAETPELKALFFSDEIGKTHGETLKGFIKLFNEHKLDGITLPRDVLIVAAGNGVIHRSGDSRLPAALTTRFECYKMDVDPEEVVDYFVDKGLSPRVCAYLSAVPDACNRWDSSALVWPNPRSWERIAQKDDYEQARGRNLSIAEIAADIGDAEAKQFYGFCTELSDLPTAAQIKAAPKSVDVPDKISHQFALVTMLVHHVDKKAFGPLKVYMQRMPLNRQVLFLKLVRKKHGSEMLNNSEYVSWITEKEMNAALANK